MNPKISRVCLVLTLVAATFVALPRPAAADPEKEVRAAVDGFYAALNEMFTGDIVPMESVWSHAADVTYMGPGGDYRVGWKQVRKSWAEQAAMKLGGDVEPEELRILVGPELAVVHNLERGVNVSPDGEPERVSIRATSVFRKEGGAWKMVGHHTDLLRFVEAKQGAAP